MPKRFVLEKWAALTLVSALVLTFNAVAAAGQTAAASVCKDGTTSTATGRGACSGHGGVDRAATKASRQAVPAATAATVVTCTDGTTSKAGRGACSHHGGISNASAAPRASSAPARATTPTRVAPSTALPPSVPRTAPERTRSDASTRTTTTTRAGGEDNNPSGAIAQCKDGLYSHAQHRRGACSRHGGVSKWMSS